MLASRTSRVSAQLREAAALADLDALARELARVLGAAQLHLGDREVVERADQVGGLAARAHALVAAAEVLGRLARIADAALEHAEVVPGLRLGPALLQASRDLELAGVRAPCGVVVAEVHERGAVGDARERLLALVLQRAMALDRALEMHTRLLEVAALPGVPAEEVVPDRQEARIAVGLGDRHEAPRRALLLVEPPERSGGVRAPAQRDHQPRGVGVGLDERNRLVERRQRAQRVTGHGAAGALEHEQPAERAAVAGAARVRDVADEHRVQAVEGGAGEPGGEPEGVLPDPLGQRRERSGAGAPGRRRRRRHGAGGGRGKDGRRRPRGQREEHQPAEEDAHGPGGRKGLAAVGWRGSVGRRDSCDSGEGGVYNGPGFGPHVIPDPERRLIR